jgi:hypothetical protein
MRLAAKSRGLLLVLLTIPFWGTMSASAQKDNTFVITIALPTPAIHVGDVLFIEETVSNPTDHLVSVGEGSGAGSMVELLNARGEDLGPHVMGPAPRDSGYVLNSSNMKLLRPRGSWKVTWHYKPEAGYLVPGTYRLRTYIRDMSSHAEVYSNAVVLTVLP